MADPITRIQILDDTTANQIAAGEVVERPSAAVKELVENALDAGATRVLVELEEGGKYLIRVTDDGCGMGQADAVLALQRHATSKITTADDLFRITTMGFRGEALPSIASVSQMTLTTRYADSPDGDDDAVGVELRCIGGMLEDVREVGARHGTSISVENLFYNVPARLKFLKSTNTELSHIVELVQRFALAFPEVAFRLVHDKREVFTAPGNGTALDACVHVFGRETARQLAPLAYEAGAVTVTGFIGAPTTLRNTRAAQHTFVNRRFIRNKAVTRALDEAYKSVQTLHGAKFPPAVVMIDIEPSLIDVNVSPTKTEVRFTREGEVYSAVYHAVREALLSGSLVATLGDKPSRGGGAAADHAFALPLLEVPAVHPVNVRGDAGVWSLRAGSPDMPVLSNFVDPFEDKLGGVTFVRDADSQSAPAPYAFDRGADTPPHSEIVAGLDGAAIRSGAPMDTQSSVGPAAFDAADGSATTHDLREWRNPGRLSAPLSADRVMETRSALGSDYRGHTAASIRVLAQTRNTYILAQTDKALLVIDQHIAHERVLYERFVNEARTGGIPVQRLVLPFTLELTKREALVVEKRLAELQKAGFELEPFGGDAFVVRSVPAAVAQKTIKAQGGPEAVLKQIVEEMVEKTISRKLLLPAEEVLITASCKMAVKAGDPLTFDEMESLVADLFKSENPYTCPHGRPIILEMSNRELDRKFGR